MRKLTEGIAASSLLEINIIYFAFQIQGLWELVA